MGQLAFDQYSKWVYWAIGLQSSVDWRMEGKAPYDGSEGYAGFGPYETFRRPGKDQVKRHIELRRHAVRRGQDFPQKHRAETKSRLPGVCGDGGDVG